MPTKRENFRIHYTEVFGDGKTLSTEDFVDKHAASNSVERYIRHGFQLHSLRL
jgi:hypothetical protein